MFNIGIFIASFISTTVVIEVVFYLVSVYLNYSNASIAIIASNLPFLACIPVSFISNYLLHKKFYNLKAEWKLVVRAMMGPFILILQLTSVFYFAQLVALEDLHDHTKAALICMSYPFLIGLQKSMLFRIVEPFDMEEVYEFGSLAFAAMPYRFIYLTVNQWPNAILVFAIKYFYKFLVYFMTLKYDQGLAEFKEDVKTFFKKFKKHKPMKIQDIMASKLKNEIKKYIEKEKEKVEEMSKKIFREDQYRKVVSEMMEKIIKHKNIKTEKDLKFDAEYYKVRSFI